MFKVIVLIIALVFTSCMSLEQIGKVNMISNRNIDPKLDYQVLSTYTSSGGNDLYYSKSETIEDAIDETVRSVPGGEFLMNAKIYLVNGKYYACEGDVWGRKDEISFRGFKVGDKVTWRVFKNYKKGTIISLKDDYVCLIEQEDGGVIEKSYDDISRSQ